MHLSSKNGKRPSNNAGCGHASPRKVIDGTHGGVDDSDERNNGQDDPCNRGGHQSGIERNSGGRCSVAGQNAKADGEKIAPAAIP